MIFGTVKTNRMEKGLLFNKMAIKMSSNTFYVLLRIIFLVSILFSWQNMYAQWSKLYQGNDMKVYWGNNMLLPENLIVDYSLLLDSCYGPIKNDLCSDIKIKPFFSIEVVTDIFSLIKNAVNSGNVGIYFKQNDNAYELINDCIFKTNIVNAEDMPSSYSGFRFIEQWHADDSTKVINKKVIAYLPLVKSFINDPYYDQNPDIPIIDEAFVVLDSVESERIINESNNRMILVNKIKYEYFLYTNNSFYDIEKSLIEYDSLRSDAARKGYKLANPKSFFLNDYSIKCYLSSLVNKAAMDNIKVYDFITDSLVSSYEVEQKLGIDIIYWDDEGRFLEWEYQKRVEREKILYNQELQSVIFIENWYIDPILLRMKKIVLGIAPVLYHFYEKSDGSNELKREIPFVFYFTRE